MEPGNVILDTVSLRSEIPNDFTATHQMLQLAFPEEDVATLVKNLRQTLGYDHELALVAELEGTIIGYAMFSHIYIESLKGNVPAIMLAPLAVHPNRQNQGIGSLLTRYGLEQCRRLGNHIVIVIGHSNYYPRFGFFQAGLQGISIDQGRFEESKMVLSLTPGSLDGVTGIVRLPTIFAET